MADYTVTHTEVTTAAAQMEGACTFAVSELLSLQNTVKELLAEGGGLWLRQSSPALDSQYQQFNGKLTEAVKNINTFATQFKGISTGLADMDEKMHAALMKA